MKEYFGIDVGGTAVKWAVLGEDFSIRERGSLPTDFATADEAGEALAGRPSRPWSRIVTACPPWA